MELLQKAVTLVLVALVRSRRSFLERALRWDGLAVDFLERSAASVDLLEFGVEAGSHGQTGSGETGR